MIPLRRFKVGEREIIAPSEGLMVKNTTERPWPAFGQDWR